MLDICPRTLSVHKLSHTVHLFSAWEACALSRPLWSRHLILETYFPAAEVEYTWCQFWSKVMTLGVEERPRLVTASYGRHRSPWARGQWVKVQLLKFHTKITHSTDPGYPGNDQKNILFSNATPIGVYKMQSADCTRAVLDCLSSTD